MFYLLSKLEKLKMMNIPYQRTRGKQGYERLLWISYASPIAITEGAMSDLHIIRQLEQCVTWQKCNQVIQNFAVRDCDKIWFFPTDCYMYLQKNSITLSLHFSLFEFLQQQCLNYTEQPAMMIEITFVAAVARINEC